jgi:hypothetical protein
MKLAYLALGMLLLSSCATYHMTTESMLTQFAQVHPEYKVTILVAPPFVFWPGIVKGNDLTQVKVLDKHEKEVTLDVTIRTGIRFTQTDGSHTTFYFNTLLLRDSTVTGSRTHFFNWQIKPIPYSSIAKIELQK